MAPEAQLLRSTSARVLRMHKGLLQAVVLAGLIMPVNAQKIARPDVPEKIKAPVGEAVVLEAHASGTQIYACQQDSNGSYTWTLKAPEAELRDSQGAIIGQHSAGPTWTLKDGARLQVNLLHTWTRRMQTRSHGC
jgi:hypothetical protein